MAPVIQAQVRKVINFAALHTDASAVIPELSIRDLACDAVLHIYSTPEFFFPFKIKLSPSAAQTVPVELTFNDAFYRKEVIESRDAVINIELADSARQEQLLSSEQVQVKLQPYLFWNRDSADLSCFMQPNSPLVVRVMKRAGELANRDGGMMSGYLNSRREDVMRQADWIFRALQEEMIHYYLPAPGWELFGQKVRIPEMILNEDCRQGTCLDMSLLYATCLEAASIHPLIILVQGHAFVGLWLDENASFPKPVTTDLNLVKRQLNRRWVNASNSLVRDAGALMPVECTMICSYAGECSWEQAVEVAAKNLVERRFDSAVDVARCRRAGYLPAFTYANDPICEPALMRPASESRDKLSRLLLQAMDLSLKNEMLAMRGDDRLSFAVGSEGFFRGNGSDEELYAALRDSALHKGMSRKELSDRLQEQFSADRLARRETGYGCVYLAVDRVKWIPKDSRDAVKAPLYLCPCEIFRNIRGEIVFRPLRDETRINPVLKEILRQDYGMDLSGFLDMPGEYYPRERALLCSTLAAQSGWQLESDVMTLGVFQIPNESIYQRLKSDRLREHPIVKGILDGSMTWDNRIPEDEASDPSEHTMAFAADSSQRNVIRMAGQRRAQVVIGPAGNGKSQTITNLIVEQILAGRHVLFVAEKPSAQLVVAEKLAELKLDPFCLCLPNDKIRFGEIRKKIDATLQLILEKRKGPFGPAAADGSGALEKLEAYYQGMYESFGEDNLAALLARRSVERGGDGQLSWRGGDEILQPDAERLATEYARSRAALDEETIRCLPYLKGFADDEYQNNSELLERSETLAGRFENILSVNCRLLNLPPDRGSGGRTLSLLRRLTDCPVLGDYIVFLPSEAEQRRRQELMNVINNAPATSRRYREAYEELYKEKKDAGAPKNPGRFRAKAALPAVTGRLYNKEEREQIENAKGFEAYQTALIEAAKGCPADVENALILLSYRIARGEGAEVLALIREVLDAEAEYRQAFALASGRIIQEEKLSGGAAPQPERLLQAWKKLRPAPIAACLSARGEMERAGLAELAGQIDRLLDSGAMTEKEVGAAFRSCRTAYICDKKEQEIDKRLPRTAELCGALQDPLQAEEAARRVYREELYRRVLASMPALAEGVENDPALGRLQKLIRRRDASASPRVLFEQADSAMKQLFPCMIMDPAAAAEWLPETMEPFDLLIFDEGSQLPTYKALIPLSMAKGCVIAGDEKQLLPTSFFQKRLEDEDGAQSRREAILEDAIITSMPQNLLCVHYRSRQEDLVAFSNERFYGGRLFSFPAPEPGLRGVRSVQVEDGRYERGGSRTNRREAEAVCEEICGILASLPEGGGETVGVITFNLEQMRLIRSMLNEMSRKGGPLAGQLSEQVDVVNLEACQGREWDYVLLSTTYGPDENGKLSLNFGPMNQNDAGNRLNVMITRARRQNIVVTSLTPDMFPESVAGGLADIRDYLAFARGDLKIDIGAGEAPEDRDPLLDAVADALQQRGLRVEKQIGSSRCKVDLAVVSEDGSRYLLGIRLDDRDGRFSIRDWECTFPGALKARGWKLYRLYALNWYRDAEKELRTIEAMLA